jgi:hypothetical protein
LPWKIGKEEQRVNSVKSWCPFGKRARDKKMFTAGTEREGFRVFSDAMLMSRITGRVAGFGIQDGSVSEGAVV